MERQKNLWAPITDLLIGTWKLLLGLMLFTFVGTFVSLNFFITPKYESQTVIYPVNVHPLSSEDPTEQMMQVLKSEDIKWQVIDSFELAEHYGLAGKQSDVISRTYERFIEFERTPYSSIKITVLDKNAQDAAAIARGIVDLLNSQILRLRREKYLEWQKFARKKYSDKAATIDSMEKRLNNLKLKNGVINLEEQSSLIAERSLKLEEKVNESLSRIVYYSKIKPRGWRDSVALHEVRLETSVTRKEKLDSQLIELVKVGDQITGLEENLSLERETLSEYKAEYEEARHNAEREITYSFVVSKAGIPSDPSFPRKTLSSVLATLSVLVLSLIVLAGRKSMTN